MLSLPSRFRYHAPEKATGSSSRVWRTGFWRHAPVSGILALIIALACGIATIVILQISDGLPVDQWRIRGHDVQPAVILSVLATIANALFRYAFDDAMRVRWWNQALEGTSFGALHRSWEHSQSVLPILTSRKHMSITALVSLSTVLLLLDGPLLQRASSIRTSTEHHQTSLSVPVSASPFMRGATGLFSDHALAPDLYNPLFAKILQQYNNRHPILIPEFGCKGQCDFDLIGPGFDIDCQDWTSPYHLLIDESLFDKQQHCLIALNATYTGSTKCPGPLNPQTMFWSNVTFGYDAIDLWFKLNTYRTGSHLNSTTYKSTIINYQDIEPFPSNSIMLSSMVKSTLGGEGTLKWRYCILREAVQRFPVTVSNKSIALRPRTFGRNYTEYLVLREQETSGQQDWPSTLGGLWLSVKHAFSGTAKLQFNTWTTIRTTDASPLVYLETPNALAMNTVNMTWSDPIDDMISMVQELSLRTAITTTSRPPPSTQGTLDNFDDPSELTAYQYSVFSPNLTNVNRTLSQTVNASVTFSELVYQSNDGWLGGALAVIGIAFAAILPLFNGWWHLGRTVSMSPIEIAKAFDAPTMSHTDSNGTAADLVSDVGETQIQYGASTIPNSTDIGIKEHSTVSSFVEEGRPKKPPPRRRLHFAAVDTVDVPHERERFD